MNAQKADFLQRIPANKFFPPRLDAQQLLFRQELIGSAFSNRAGNKKFILFEAQAGQGKTTTALQYLECNNIPFAWYQIGPEDADPVLTLTCLLYCLKQYLPSYSSPLLEKIISAGDISISELSRYANLLLNDLSPFLQEDFFLVLDDFHLLEESPHSRQLFNYLMETAPPRLHFMLLSRRAIPRDRYTIERHHNTVLLTNETLSFSEGEIHALYDKVFHLSLPQQHIRHLHEATDGWVMGLVLMGHSLKAQETLLAKHHPSMPAAIEKENVYEFFKTEIFSKIPARLYKSLLTLSLLDEIPIPLAKQICQDPHIDDKLVELKKQNFFVRSLDRENQLFSFHHLFRDYLSQRAGHELPAEEIARTLRETAAYYLSRKNVEKCLAYLGRSKDIASMEMVLEMYGMDLLALHRVMTLHDILKKLPSTTIREHGWLSFFYASSLMEIDPQQALSFLTNAKQRFHKLEAEIGELLATAQLIYFQMFSGGEYKRGAILLPRADYLFSKHLADLDDFSKVLIAKNLAYGYCFFTSDTRKANLYALLANKLATEQHLHNFMAATQGILTFEKYFSGDLKACLAEIENGFHYLQHPKVSELNRLTIFGAMLSYLDDNGDHEVYLDQEAILRQSIDNDLICHSIINPYLALWNINMAVSKGLPKEALAQIENSYGPLQVSYNSHLNSQFLHFKAYCLALLEKKRDALVAAQLSLQAMETGGGNHYFVILNSLMIAATFIQLKLYDEAEPLLIYSLKLCIDHNQFFLRAALYLQRAFLHLQRQEDQLARQDLKQGLQCMRLYGFGNPYTLTPGILLEVLRKAVSDNIESNYAQKLANQRLNLSITPTGDTLPILTIRTMGTFSITAGEKVLLQAEELPPTQRTFLGLLIIAPDCKISQEHLQLMLWPDSPPDKARGSLDTLLLRLRKALAKATAPVDVKNYLVLQRGYLALKNCRIDVLQFKDAINTAIQHSQNQNLWQAGLKFTSAMKFWQGEFLHDVTDNDHINDFRYDTTQLYVNGCIEQATIFSKTGKLTDAIQVTEHAMRYDLFHDGSVSLLYHLQKEANQPLKAEQTLMRYRDLLRREEYSEEDIEVVVKSITAPRHAKGFKENGFSF